jgi:hypothetical protein
VLLPGVTSGVDGLDDVSAPGIREAHSEAETFDAAAANAIRHLIDEMAERRPWLDRLMESEHQKSFQPRQGSRR